MRHVVFRIDKDRYAFPLTSVREVVVAPPRFRPVPRAPPCIRGVMNLRGRIVTVVDLPLLVHGKSATSELSRVVMLDRGRYELGLLVSTVETVEIIERTTAPSSSSLLFAKGVARLGGVAVTVLDPDLLDKAVAHAVASD